MKLYMAPIKGITDFVYREAYANHFKGIDIAVSPFVSSVQSRKIKDSYLNDLHPDNNQDSKIIPQILSKDPDDFIFIAEQLFELGYDEVNWNLGCPTPMIAKKRRGSGLLPYPERIEAFLEKVTAKYPERVSVKTRLGRHSPDELFALMPIFNSFPLKSITIHPRLGVQMYKGDVDLGVFSEAVKHNRLPLIYNGDINNVEFFGDISKKFKSVDAWMVGRGMLRNPYLPAMIKNINFEISRETLLSFHNEIFARYTELLAGPGHLVARMKGFWFYYSHIFAKASTCHKRITKARGVDHYLDAVKRNFEEEDLAFL